MVSRSTPLIGCLVPAMLVAGPACGDVVGIVWQEDAFGLDHVTPLEEVDGYAGQRVINVYAQLDDPADQVVAVFGSTELPFEVRTVGGSGFVNSVFPNDLAPDAGLLEFFVDLNFDSFMTIGYFSLGPLCVDLPVPCINEVITSPFFIGPNVDPWPGVAAEFGLFAPEEVDGLPTPQTLAGNFPDLRVLLMRLVVAPGEDITGTFRLLAIVDGNPIETPPLTFTTSCPSGDVDCDGNVNVVDLLQVILAWGVCDPPAPCPADLNGDGTVDVSDLLLVVLGWG